MPIQEFVHNVYADYSQFYIVGNNSWFDEESLGDYRLGLVQVDPRSNVLLTTFQQWGHVPVQIRIYEDDKPPLDNEFQDVVEFSVFTREQLCLSGWDGSDDMIPLNLKPNTSYRVRYSVKGADDFPKFEIEWFEEVQTFGDLPETYRLEFWESSMADGEILSESFNGQYWNHLNLAAEAKSQVAGLPRGKQTEALVRIALKAHPELAAAVAAGDDRALSGLVPYPQKVYPSEFEHDEEVAMIRELAGFQRDGILDETPSSFVYISPQEPVKVGWFSSLLRRIHR